MNTKIIFTLGLIVSLGSFACGTSTETPDAGGVPDGGVAGPPAAPALGAMIDRMGRPAINTALTDPFSTTQMAMEDMNKDNYNKAAQTTWATTFKAPFATSLAIFDSLDRNCGNQVAAGMTAVAGRYDTLAGLLADDQLYVRSDKTNCSQYLAVELGVAGQTVFDTDCGGRTLSYDVVDVTYSALAAGGISGVTDGVANDSNFTQLFPFLAAPQ